MSTESIRQKVLLCIPHFRHAIKKARAEGKAEIGILAITDKGGRVICHFEAEEFIEDLAKLVGAGPHTEEDEMVASAQEIVDLVRASGGSIVDKPVEGCTCGSGGHPRHCAKHPEAYAAHVAEINAEWDAEEE
jgi:hypothetical protein